MIGCHVAVPCSHWSAVPTPLFDNMAAACLQHFPVVEGLIFCISATPIWKPPSHYSMKQAPDGEAETIGKKEERNASFC